MLLDLFIIYFLLVLDQSIFRLIDIKGFYQGGWEREKRNGAGVSLKVQEDGIFVTTVCKWKDGKATKINEVCQKDE